jgi:hypothetical protein
MVKKDHCQREFRVAGAVPKGLAGAGGPMSNAKPEERRRGRRARSRARCIGRGRQRAGTLSRPPLTRSEDGAPPRLYLRADRPGNSPRGMHAPIPPAPRRRRGGRLPPATRANSPAAPWPRRLGLPSEILSAVRPRKQNSVTLGDRGVRKPLLHVPVAFSSREPVAYATGSYGVAALIAPAIHKDLSADRVVPRRPRRPRRA